MTPYVNAAEQLVTEVFVSDIRRTIAFYRELGFDLLRDDGDFVELMWETHRFFLAQAPPFCDASEVAPSRPSPPFPVANVRVMVRDVDSMWKRANEIGARIVAPIGDRSYGLRDFTLVDPDGFGIRFATVLPKTAPMEMLAQSGSSPIRVLAISGSLRAASSNSAAVRAMMQLAPDGVAVSIYEIAAALRGALVALARAAATRRNQQPPASRSENSDREPQQD